MYTYFLIIQHPGPTELVKCQMQTDIKTVGIKEVPDSWQTLKNVWRKQGVYNGLFRGLTATIFRDVPSCGIYFGVYEGMKRHLTSASSEYNNMPMSALNSFIIALVSGATAGCSLWASIYPLDVVKTRIQSLRLDTPSAQRTLLVAVSSAYRDGGYAIFFKGLGVTLLRAIPTNAVTLATYEVTINSLRQPFLFGEEHHRKDVVYPVYFY